MFLSRTLQKIQLSNLGARFATTENNLTAPHYKEGKIFKIKKKQKI